MIYKLHYLQNVEKEDDRTEDDRTEDDRTIIIIE